MPPRQSKPRMLTSQGDNHPSLVGQANGKRIGQPADFMKPYREPLLPANMANRFQIPQDVETRLRRAFKVCAYCRRRMKAHVGVIGNPPDKATIEHLNRHGPFHWRDGLLEDHLVICCGRCNSSRGTKRLSDWFAATYCLGRGINTRTVAARVRRYALTALAKR